MLEPEGGGPRKRVILDALFGAERVNRWIKGGVIVMIGDRKGAKYGLLAGRERRRPGLRKAA